MGHAALKGCSRCLKSFPTESLGQKPDYSGFNRSGWPKRTTEDHKRIGISWKHAPTASKRHEIEQNHGVRFTDLLRIPYFDTVRFIVVDPMHSIFLGTAKRLVSIWKIIPDTEFDSIQGAVNEFTTAADIGRIPHKISSQFSSFTADQWKNWTLVYSLVVLKFALPRNHYECWCIFVDMCHLLCSRALSFRNVEKVDELIVHFCQTFEHLYGSEACTPTLHLHQILN